MKEVTSQTGASALKQRAALWSIAASVGITIAKGAAGLASGSLALISDAAHSLLDVAATTITWIVVRAADKPADEEHHYGHGKLESLAALIETAFLFLLSGVVAYEGLRRLSTGTGDVQASWVAVAVLVGSIIVDAWRWWGLKKVARETGSEALDADALHFSADLVNSALVLAALGAVAAGYPQADALVAIGVSLFIAGAGFRLAKRTVDTLLDAAPRGVAEAIGAKVADVPGVAAVKRVRVRNAGGRVHGEVLVQVARSLPLDHVATLKSKLLQEIDQVSPNAEMAVMTEPMAVDDETALERVLVIAAKLRIPVHHVTVQEIEGRTSVSLDLEVDGHMSLGDAHARATKLESEIRDEFGPEIEVDTHIEPLRVSPLAGRDEAPSVVAGIKAALTKTAAEIASVTDIHSVRVRRTEAGLVVNYHCRLDAALPVSEVHARVDELERRVRSDHPEILRIVGHAEPLGRDHEANLAAGGSRAASE